MCGVGGVTLIVPGSDSVEVDTSSGRCVGEIKISIYQTRKYWNINCNILEAITNHLQCV